MLSGGGGGGHVGVHASEERPYSVEKLSMYVHVVGIRLSGGGGGGAPIPFRASVTVLDEEVVPYPDNGRWLYPAA